MAKCKSWAVRLPAAERAWIDLAKIRDSLLCKEHAVGRVKAVLFERLGCSTNAWQLLEADLRALAIAAEATLGKQTKYGEKGEVAPNGSN